MAGPLGPHKITRQSLVATAEFERLGLNPIEMLAEVYKEAMQSYREEPDKGATYLAVAAQVANNLANYKHPKLAAVAIKDVSDERESKSPMTTQQAIEVMKKDPFNISDSRVIEASKSTIKVPFLPSGESQE